MVEKPWRRLVPSAVLAASGTIMGMTDALRGQPILYGIVLQFCGIILLIDRLRDVFDDPATSPTLAAFLRGARTGIRVAVLAIVLLVFVGRDWRDGIARLVAWVRYPECRNAPSVVEYRQGMTLCPGQTARGALVIIPKAATPAPDKSI